MIRKLSIGMLCLCATLAIGCGDGDDDGEDSGEAIERFVSAARDCNLVSEEGDYAPSGVLEYEQREQSSFRDCVLDCIREGGCDDIADFICSGLESTTENDCREECDDADSISCDIDENPATVVASSICDGDEDCDDGADEEDCDMFTCDNENEIPASWECDGEEDCADDSDEDEHCDHFTCTGSGNTILASDVCDDENDCGNVIPVVLPEGGIADTSDEDDCAELTCTEI